MEIMPAPASTKESMYMPGCSIIRCVSMGSLVTERIVWTMIWPMVILGTKWPSITSTCSMSTPASSQRLISSPNFVKSAQRMLALILMSLGIEFWACSYEARNRPARGGYRGEIECAGEDLNLHGLPHTPLKRARLPFRHPRVISKSEMSFVKREAQTIRALRLAQGPSRRSPQRSRWDTLHEIRFTSKDAFTNSRNKGCARSGLDLNSGWNWHATNHGWLDNSMISTRSWLALIPVNIMPAFSNCFL